MALMAVVAASLAACQPKTIADQIDTLERLVKDDAKTLSRLEAKTFAQLKNDFFACDSMLQYLHPEQVEENFQQLQLIGAYLEQFKATQGTLRADIDSTLGQLGRLKADVESHYLSDSLAAVYLDDETQHAILINNQVGYFKDRLATCQKDLEAMKKQMK